MKDLIEKRVRKILEDDAKARDDDNRLMVLYFQSVGYDADRSFREVMNDKSAPNRESVTRARRKLQEKYEHLRGTKYVRRLRAKREKEFREYARS